VSNARGGAEIGFTPGFRWAVRFLVGREKNLELLPMRNPIFLDKKEDIKMNKTRDDFPLSNKKPIKKTIAYLIPFLGVVAGLLFMNGILAAQLAIPFGSAFGWISKEWVFLFSFFLVYLICSYVYQVLYFQSYFYDLGDDLIIIRKGVMSTREITLAYERIQDINVDQDFLDRLFGLYDVHFTTATMSSEKEARIDGVEKDTAESLKQFVLEIVKARIKKVKGA